MNDQVNQQREQREEEYGSSEECGSSLDPTPTAAAATAIPESATYSSSTNNHNGIGSTPTNSIPVAKTFNQDCLIEQETSPNIAQNSVEDSVTRIGNMYQNHNKILGRNLNGTIAMTTQPSNESELQLYRVLQRANLLAYYDTFICQGGDDVQQLYEAGEEEFLEIMALVGMAAKPLHVRRLQKALHEWATNPALFQSPLGAQFPTNPVCPTTISNNNNNETTLTNTIAASNHNVTGTIRSTLAHHHHHHSSPRNQNNSPSLSGSSATTTTTTNATASTSIVPFSSGGNQSKTPSPSQLNNNEYSQPCSPGSMNPILMDNQIQRLAEAAETLVKNLPPNMFDMKPPSVNNNNGNKKRIVKEIENIMSMSDNDPRRIDEIRKYAAIYGRFDCKRKPEKPLTLHEVSVNEAAAQICSKIPQLLYRRDELFPLARQVVRDSGYQYSKGHSRSQGCKILEEHLAISSESNGSGGKRMRLDANLDQDSSKSSIRGDDRKRRHNRLEGIVDQLKSLGSQQEEIQSQIKDANERQNFQEVTELQNELDLINDHQMQLVEEKSELELQNKSQEPSKQSPSEQQDHNRSQERKMLESEKTETEDTDSQFSLYSNESTPSLLQDNCSRSSPSLQNHESGSNQNHTNVENVVKNDLEQAATKSTENKKKTQQHPAGTNINNNNGNNNETSCPVPATSMVTPTMINDDSMDFGKQLNEVIDEGLRLMGHVMEENIDLQLFNKYTEVLRSNTNSAEPPPPPPPLSAAAAAVVSNSCRNNNKTETVAQSHQPHRSRGRPPKNLSQINNSSNNNPMDRDLHSTFYEQLLSSAQIQQQMQLYQTQLQQSLYAQALLSDFNVTAAAAAVANVATTGISGPPETSTFITNDIQKIGGGGVGVKTAGETTSGNILVSDKNNLSLENSLDRDEIVQSLSALISMSSNNNRPTTDSGNGTIKPELNNSVEFKIA